MIPREELLTVRRLASRANPRIKDWAGIGDRAERDRLGLTMAEGAKLAGEALASFHGGLLRPKFLLISDSGAEREEAGELFRLAGELGVERYSLSDDCYGKISGLKNADGIAVLAEFSRDQADIPALLSQPGAKWLAAAGVQDPGNAGALARTALAAGASGCLFLDGADPVSPKFLRGSMGAAFRLPCLSMTADAFVSVWPETTSRLILATGDKGKEYHSVDYAPPMVLLVGGERGIPEPVQALPHDTARIPLHGEVESLNLAVAAGIILFTAEREWFGGNPA